MLTQCSYANAKPAPVMAACPLCKDRARFESQYEIVCTCSVARWGYVNRNLQIRTIQATVTEHVCDARCTGAKGWKCDCSCGGRNHGRDFSAAA